MKARIAHLEAMSMKLAPGKYKIEIRNTTFAAHTESIEVKSRDELTIRHRFQ